MKHLGPITIALTLAEKNILDRFKKKAIDDAYAEIQFRREEKIRNAQLEQEYIELLQWDGRCACIEKGLIKKHCISKDKFVSKSVDQGMGEAGWEWSRKFRCYKCGNWYRLIP